MVIHFAPPAHHVTDAVILVTVACAAGNGVLLQNVHALAAHLSVTHQVARRCQGRQTGTDNICRFVFGVRRFLWAGKRLIITTGIIHTICFLSFGVRA